MRYRYIALLLGLLLTLTACGSGNAVSADSQPVPEPEAFGAETFDSAPAQMAETTNAPETAPAEAESTPEAPAPEVNLDELALTSVLLSVYVDGQTYDPQSSGFFWRALGYLVGYGGTDTGAVIEDGRAKLTEQQLQPLVTGLFGPYEGQYPALTEEDPLVTSEYVDGEMVYSVTLQETMEYTVNRSEPEPQEDDTCRCRAELRKDGEVLGAWTVTLTACPSEPGGPFTYCIRGLEAE